MQLILVLALLLAYGGRGGQSAKNLLNDETVELIKYISPDGGEEVERIVKEAEQLSGLISAFAPLMSATADEQNSQSSDSNIKNGSGIVPSSDDFLKPISNLADRRIYTALAGAVS